MKRREFGAIIILFAVLLATAFSQERSIRIIGTITDSTGVALASARVTVVNGESNASVEVKSDAAGNFSVSSLPAGTYTVFIKKEGFRPHRRDQIVAAPSQTVRVDARLTPGQTESSAVGRCGAFNEVHVGPDPPARTSLNPPGGVS